MDKTPMERYLEHLLGIFEVEPVVYKEVPVTEGLPEMSCFVYPDIPEEGMITGVTYGLSLTVNPDWTVARPELIISVESSDPAWAKVVSEIANKQRGECPVAYGQTINYGGRIASDSEMDAFLVYAPAILDEPEFVGIEIGLEYKLNLVGLYPIYSSEIELIEEWGIDEFWDHPDFDIYNVKRKRIVK